jgi:predicted dinucleotide-utilizing enzyme
MTKDMYEAAVNQLKRHGYEMAMAKVNAKRVAMSEASDEEFRNAHDQIGAISRKAAAIIREIARDIPDSLVESAVDKALYAYTTAILNNLIVKVL